MDYLPDPDPNCGDKYATVYVGKDVVTMTRNITSPHYYLKMDLESQSKVGKGYPGMRALRIDMMTYMYDWYLLLISECSCRDISRHRRYGSPPS
jgi:hypothetical protein